MTVARKYLPPTNAKAKGIHVPAPTPVEPAAAAAPAPAPAPDPAPEPDGPQVPAESETRDTLEAFAVEHAGLTEEQAKAYPNKGELHAAITAALASNPEDDQSE